MWKRWLSCHAGRQEVGRCHTRGESQGMCNITHMPGLSTNKAEPTLALKPRGDITRSPKQGYQWPPKKGRMSSKKILKKKKNKIKLFTIAIDYSDENHQFFFAKKICQRHVRVLHVITKITFQFTFFINFIRALLETTILFYIQCLTRKNSV